MGKDEDKIDEYLKANGIKMQAVSKQPVEFTGQYVDPEIEEWYRANGMDGAIIALKDAKMKDRIEKLNVKLAAKGARALGLVSEKDKENIKKDIEKALERSDKKERDTKADKDKEIVDDEKVTEERDSEEKEQGVKEGNKDKDKKAGEKPKTSEERQKEEQEYLDKLIKLHEEKMKAYKEQRKRDKLVPTDRELILMIRLQQEINRGREKYERQYGKEELAKLINKNFGEEKKEEKKILDDHQKKIDRLEELNNQLDEILGKIEALEYQMREGQISEQDYEQEKKFLQKEKLDVLWDINEMNPAILAEEERKFSENEKIEDKALGQGFDRQQRKDLTDKNIRASKEMEQTKKEQSGVVKEQNEGMKESHKQAIANKDMTIDELETKIANSRDEEDIIIMTGQVADLEADKDISNEQQNIVLDKDNAGYTEIENPTIIEGNFAEELDDATRKFKDVMEEQGKLKEEVLPEPKKEQNPFIQDMQEKVVDIENDPDAAKAYLDAIRETTDRAREYNRELEEAKDTPEIK